MSRSPGLALASLAVLLVSSTSAFAQLRGAQCTPAVANPQMYQNCRIQIVDGDEVCRCAVAPRSIRGTLRQDDNDRNGIGTITGTTSRNTAGRGPAEGISTTPGRSGTTSVGINQSGTAARGVPGAPGAGVTVSTMPAGPVATAPAPISSGRATSGSAQPVAGAAPAPVTRSPLTGTDGEVDVAVRGNPGNGKTVGVPARARTAATLAAVHGAAVT
jgi:hypothetical protein